MSIRDWCRFDSLWDKFVAELGRVAWKVGGLMIWGEERPYWLKDLFWRLGSGWSKIVVLEILSRGLVVPVSLYSEAFFKASCLLAIGSGLQ
jgi:hypothetical protein